jgi:hypothetical protein
MIQYKGKGEHSVQGLEHIIEYQNEELHQLKTNWVKYLDRLKQQYKITKTEAPNKQLQELRLTDYQAMRLFCLDCELVSFNEVELMEFEVNQSFTS